MNLLGYLTKLVFIPESEIIAAQAEELKEVAADRDQWKARAEKAERDNDVSRNLLNLASAASINGKQSQKHAKRQPTMRLSRNAHSK